MKDYAVVVRYHTHAIWRLKAESPREALVQWQQLRWDGEGPDEEDVKDCDIIQLIEDGVPLPAAQLDALLDEDDDEDEE
jgi:hypothetical protein